MKIYIKRIAAAVIAAALSLTAASCGKSPETEKGGIKIITTNFPPYDFIREITGGEIEATMLLSGGQDSHSFEPTAKDIVKINEADLFICTGGESDSWIDTVSDSLTGDVKIIKMMDYVTPLEIDHGHEDEEHNEHEEGDHHHEEKYDEHVWTSPINAIKISEGITEALCEISPENAEKYRSGLSVYEEKLTALDKKLKETAEKLKKPLIFGDRFPFTYLAHDYGISYHAAFSGCSSETEPSAAKMTELIDEARAADVRVIYYIEFSTRKVADTIAEAVGAEVRLMHSCHSLSDEELKAGESYISLMEKNILAMSE